MKGAPSQQGGGSGGFGGGGFPQWLGMASQYFPQYFGGYQPQGGPQGGSAVQGGMGGNPGYPTYTGPPRDQPLGAPPAPPPMTGGAEPPPISAPPNPMTPPQMAGLLGSGGLTSDTTAPSNVMGHGLLSGMPQRGGWMPGYGGSRGYGGGGQPGGIVPPQQQSGPQPYSQGYGLLSPFAQY